MSIETPPPTKADHNPYALPCGASALEALPRACLVTGAGLRLGRAIALEMARCGFDVAIHFNRSETAAEETAAAVREFGRMAITLHAELTHEQEVETLVKRAAKSLGPLGVLVNNASIFEFDSALSANRASWDKHMEANLRAPFVLSQELARNLPASARGAIVNIIDQRVWNLTPHFISYTLSKAGLWTLTQTLAMALAPRVRVNAVGPGPTLPSPRQTQDQFERQCHSMPLQAGTSPTEIAHAVRFTLEAPSMTGQMIALDGGQHLGWAQPPRSDEEVEE